VTALRVTLSLLRPVLKGTLAFVALVALADVDRSPVDARVSRPPVVVVVADDPCDVVPVNLYLDPNPPC
jgi:hypothetical protein